MVHHTLTTTVDSQFNRLTFFLMDAELADRRPTPKDSYLASPAAPRHQQLTEISRSKNLCSLDEGC